MSADSGAQPAADAWVAAIHASEQDFRPIGAALVLDARRVLTCAHVVVISEEGQVSVRDPLWVSFPMVADAAGRPRRRVTSVALAYEPPVTDLALLNFEEDMPAGVDAAPLRFPKPSDVVSKKWWAFGFPDCDPIGDCADGLVGASLAFGWIRLKTTSEYLVRPGFSGGGLWSPDYQAVVGVVAQADGNGNGRAIALHQADACFPAEKLAMLASWSADAAGEVALAAWGWTLSGDPEGVRHWRPRARGVSIDSERGFRFRGRTRALTRIAGWLDRPVPDRRVLVVTGSPGAGKSAVLGRIVTTSDPAIRALLPERDDAVRASPGSVSCAVHAKAKTALEVANEIARAASARLPDEPGDLAPAVRDALEDRGGQRFNVIIDALDEAASPAQARAIISKIVLPLAETCSDAGAQVIVGTRRQDDDGNLLTAFGGALAAVDLDDPKYFEEADLAAYAQACLQLAGDERTGNPYAPDAVAEPVARRIAEMSDGNFLVAGLVARGHGMHDEHPAAPEYLAFDATVDFALAAYLERLSPVAGLAAGQVLTALAFAEAPGLPPELWQAVIESIYDTPVTTAELSRFARSSAANFLVQSRSGGTAPTFRLFHQALNDALLSTRAQISPRRDDERAVTRTLMRYGREGGWGNAPDYLLRSLPGHAAAAGLIDSLLADDTYLLHADLRRLMLAADYATSPASRRRIQLLGLTPQAAEAPSGERAAMFSVTEVLENLGSSYQGRISDAPYLGRWAQAKARRARAILEGHEGWVIAVCAVTADGRQLLASGGYDGTVRIWDPASGEGRAVLAGHQGWVHAVCTVMVHGRQLLASGGDDGTVRIWDPASGAERAVLAGHQEAVQAVCTVMVDGRQMLASGGGDGTVLIWDPDSEEQHAVLQPHQCKVYGLCPVMVHGRQLLASGGDDGTVRIWDPAAGAERAVLAGHQDRARAVCTVMVHGQQMLASGGDDRMVRIWDPETGEQRTILVGHQYGLGRVGGVNAVCAIAVDGRELLASSGADGTVRIWDPAAGEQRAVLEGSSSYWVRGVCAITVADRELLAAGGDDGMVRIWDPASEERQAAPAGHGGWVNAVCAVTAGGRRLLASGGGDGTVRIWDAASGDQRALLKGHQRKVLGLCAVWADGRELLASASADGTVRIWDPETGEQRAVFEGHRQDVCAVCAVTVDGRQLLASGGGDRTVRIWDPISGEQRAMLVGHIDWISAVCAVTVENRQLLASSGGFDRTVRICDPETGEQRAVLAGHQDYVNGVCAVTVEGRQLLASCSRDQTVGIWDPASGQQLDSLEGHEGSVNTVCSVMLDGRELLASGGSDGTVRIWDPVMATALRTIPAHHEVRSAMAVADSLGIGLNAGILFIDLNPG